MADGKEKAEGSGTVPPQPAKLDPANLMRMASVLHEFVPKKGKSGSGVADWLGSTVQTLVNFSVPQEQWVYLAVTRISPDVANAYRNWSGEGNTSRKSWAGFEEFMIRHFVGAASGLDAFMRISNMQLPTVATEIYQSLRDIKTLCELTEIKTADDYYKMQIISMMPSSVMLQILERPEGIRSLTDDAISAMLQAHYAAKNVVTRGEPMDVDTVRKENTTGELKEGLETAALQRGTRRNSKVKPKVSADGSGASRVPSYDIFKAWVSRDEYERRVQNKLCIGCGQDHRWAHCALNGRPKEQRE